VAIAALNELRRGVIKPDKMTLKEMKEEGRSYIKNQPL
jgi:hypothetical protein